MTSTILGLGAVASVPKRSYKGGFAVARKHSKQNVSKQSVTRTLIEPERTERKVVQNPVTGEVEVKHVVIPAAYQQGRATASTTKRGKPNVPPGKKEKVTK